MSFEHVEKIAEAVGGKIEEVGRLPDGSGFAVMSMPLRADHWIYATTPEGHSLPPPMPLRMAMDHPQRKEWHDAVRAATMHAVRGATMNGKDMDFDPDALVQNMLVGLFGYHTADGLSSESYANPDPVPPLFEGRLHG